MAAAALTIFEGQAVFALVAPSPAGIERLFRLRCGSRLHAVQETRS
jgi:hypothetical protein